MPLHWDWDCDWDLHHEHYWHFLRSWPWDSFGLHSKCPWRRSNWWTDFDVCARDWTTHHIDAPWCHRSCLTGKVAIETGDEPDTNGKGTFKIVIDVHHFRHDELLVKIRNMDTVVLEGKQKDDRADKGAICITREFTRKYKLPRNYDATQATATFTKDGILTICVPAPPPLDDVERVVDILETGTYYGSSSSNANEAKAIENGENKKNED